MASSTMAVRISGRDLQARLRHLVDPHLDEVDAPASRGADHLARLVRRGGLLGTGDGQTRGFAGRRRAARAGGQGDGDDSEDAFGISLSHSLNHVGGAS